MTMSHVYCIVCSGETSPWWRGLVWHLAEQLAATGSGGHAAASMCGLSVVKLERQSMQLRNDCGKKVLLSR